MAIIILAATDTSYGELFVLSVGSLICIASGYIMTMILGVSIKRTADDRPVYPSSNKVGIIGLILTITGG